MNKKIRSTLSLITILIVTISINYYLNQRKVTDDTVMKIIENNIYGNNKMNATLRGNDNDYNNFFLLFNPTRLNTNNFISFFSVVNEYNYKIIEVYPYINALYENNLKSYIDKIIFINTDLSASLNTLVEKYINVLNDYGLDDEINKVNIKGVPIKKVLINISNKGLKQLLSKYPDVKYSTNLNGNYYTLY